jgi:hypothetical protein
MRASTDTFTTPPLRGGFDGVLAIVRFNWPYYAAVAVALLASVLAFLLAPPRSWYGTGALLLFAGSAWLLVASLAAAHLVYDRSDLYRFGWFRRLPRATMQEGRCLLSCSTGLDETSALLRAALPERTWHVLDHFDESTMSEPSIRRARRHHTPPSGSEPSPIAAWPVPDAWADGIFALLAIHELRHREERVAWFTEARRCLAPGGCLILAEHVRDAANFLAFGPGALHFHSPATWRSAWVAAGLGCTDEFRVTPFVRVFVLGAVAPA